MNQMIVKAHDVISNAGNYASVRNQFIYSELTCNSDFGSGFVWTNVENSDYRLEV